MHKFRKFISSRKHTLQNIMIVILCITVLIELQDLWFVNLANGQPLYQKQASKTYDVAIKKEILSPFRILSNIGENEFYVTYEGQKFSDLKAISEKILLDCSKNADFIESTEELESYIFSSDSVIFDYTYILNGKIITEALNTNKNNLSRVEDFDKIIYVPNENSIDVIFLNTEEEVSTKLNLKNTQLQSELLEKKGRIYSSPTYKYNIDTNRNVEYNELIATNNGTPIYYNKIQSKNPYATIYGESPRNLVESKIKKYFKNYYKVSTSENAYVFSDTDTVIKYFDTGVLEYSFYNISAKKTDFTLLDDFAVAKSFLEQDEDIINNYYLKSYYKNDFECVFEFDYVLENYPINFAYDILEENSAITITIKNNIVTNLKKVVTVFEKTEDVTIVSKPFYEAIEVLSAPNNSEVFVKDVNLGYKIIDINENAALYWFMNVFDSEISLSTN